MILGRELEYCIDYGNTTMCHYKGTMTFEWMDWLVLSIGILAVILTIYWGKN